MKKLLVIICLIISFSSISAQKYSLGIKYSTLLDKSNNYLSGNLFEINGDYEVLKNKISIGTDAALVLTENFLIEDLANHVSERSFNLSFNVKYYPYSLYIYDSLTIRPYLSAGVGLFLIHNMDIQNGVPACNELYRVSTDDYFNTYLSLGIILFPEEINLVFDWKYLIRNPKIDVDKPVCSPDESGGPKSFNRYSKNVNLNMFLFSFGIRFNI